MKQSDGLKKWPPSAWQRLFELVLPALNDLPKTMPWTLGGGTGLAISLDHRISYDIDIFFEHTAVLKLLSPNKNKKIRELSDHWQQPGHYLKIERPEGDIDFLVTRLFTDPSFFLFDFQGTKIRIETPAEIILKKLHYRGSQFTVRDIFDIAAFSTCKAANSIVDIPDVMEALPRTLNKIQLLQSRYEESIQHAVNPTPSGKQFLENGYKMALCFLESLMSKSS